MICVLDSEWSEVCGDITMGYNFFSVYKISTRKNALLITNRTISDRKLHLLGTLMI